MADYEPQRFVSYRSVSDEFEISFIGGPLDGAIVRTDIYPDSTTFVHRVRSRNYTYCYQQVSAKGFRAQLIHGNSDPPPLKARPAKWRKLVLIAFLAALSFMVGWTFFVGLTN